MITPEQREARKKFIGSSDMAAILGLSPYASAEDIRLEKAGKLEDWKGNEATEAGIYLEPAILHWAHDRLFPDYAGDHNPDWKEDTMHVHKNGIMCANLDAEAMQAGLRIIIEGKTSGIVGPIIGNWGTPGTNEVPEMHLIQVMHQLAVTGYERGFVAGLIGGRGLCIYQIDPDQELIELLEERAEYFWKKHVLADVPAANSLASLEVARRIKRQPGVVMPIAEDICDEVTRALAVEKVAKENADKAKARLLSLANGADAIARGDGPIIATYKPNKNNVRSLRFKEGVSV